MTPPRSSKPPGDMVGRCMPNSGPGGYDHFCVPCWHPTCKFLLMKFFDLRRMAISRADFWCFITSMCMKNRTMGILVVEDGHFVNLLIFEYLYTPGKTRQGRVTGVGVEVGGEWTNAFRALPPRRYENIWATCGAVHPRLCESTQGGGYSSVDRDIQG